MSKNCLVSIFLRGGMDGLNVVIPYSDPDYHTMRPTIGIPDPQSGDNATALDLDGFYSLHPALAPLLPHYQNGSLAFVHAIGLPDPTHSHFEAQDNLERGVLNTPATTSGWINRALAGLNEAQPSDLRAVAFGALLPATLRGPAPAIAMTSIQDFHLVGRMGDLALYRQALQSLYSQTPAGPAAPFETQLTLSAGEVRQVEQILTGLPTAGATQNTSNPYPGNAFSKVLQQVAQLIKADIGLEVACLDLPGWDMHANEGGVDGALARLLATLGQGLAAFSADLGDRFGQVIILTMSEFGRRAKENGSHGTDHGHGNVMFVMGGAVAGGKVYGTWPTLASDALYGPGDLAVTSDYRDVFNEILATQNKAINIPVVFPNYTPHPIGLIKS